MSLQGRSALGPSSRNTDFSELLWVPPHFLQAPVWSAAQMGEVPRVLVCSDRMYLEFCRHPLSLGAEGREGICQLPSLPVVPPSQLPSLCELENEDLETEMFRGNLRRKSGVLLWSPVAWAHYLRTEGPSSAGRDLGRVWQSPSSTGF